MRIRALPFPLKDHRHERDNGGAGPKHSGWQPDLVGEQHDTGEDFASPLSLLENLVHSVAPHIRKDEARVSAYPAKLYPQLLLQLCKGRTLLDDDVHTLHRHPGIVQRHDRELDGVWRLRHRQREIHDRVERHRDIRTDRALHLRADLELEKLHDPGVVPLQVLPPSLFRHHGVGPALCLHIWQRGPWVDRPVDILVQAVQHENQQFVCILLLEAAEFWSLLPDQRLQFRGHTTLVAVRPHLGKQSSKLARKSPVHR
mmetsp:Transcript_93033/g.236647  ORF Transcript_93033/g.236647 Transcript_93033/m.236647 type:complete len:257 (+) Transcript_93033:973-1743(+)